MVCCTHLQMTLTQQVALIPSSAQAFALRRARGISKLLRKTARKCTLSVSSLCCKWFAVGTRPQMLPETKLFGRVIWSVNQIERCTKRNSLGTFMISRISPKRGRQPTYKGARSASQSGQVRKVCSTNKGGEFPASQRPRSKEL